jgi:hypothetical protein
MPTEIETCLLRRDAIHGVIEVALAEKRLVVSVAPWEELDAVVSAEFTDVRITSIQVDPDDLDELNLPWDLIGFDCYPLVDERWRFVLCCLRIECCFEAPCPRCTVGPRAGDTGPPAPDAG